MYKFIKLCSYSIVLLMIIISTSDGKGFGGGRSGGSKGGSRGPGSFGGQGSYGKVNSYGSNTGKSYGGSSLKNSARSFIAGAAGAAVGYSIMRGLSGTYHSRPNGFYGPGYGGGQTCTNNENLNGTVFGQFRCPIFGFEYHEKYCCGEVGQQYCCARENGIFNGGSHFGWVIIVIIIILLIIVLFVCCRKRREKDAIMVPTEPPMNDQYVPPPQQQYPSQYPSPGVNPYAYSPPNQPMNFNPYQQPPQSPMQYSAPPFQQPQPYVPYGAPPLQPYNPY